MPILLPPGLPATRDLRTEGVDIVAADGGRSATALRIGLVNLMPDRPRAETQFARLLAGAPHLVELVLLHPASHTFRPASRSHVNRFYRPWPDVRSESFDGLVVTGAPVESLHFEQVDYWAELCRILDWAEERVPGSLWVCWAAQAALHHRHGVHKLALRHKAFGVFEQEIRTPGARLVQGFGRFFPSPVSRHTGVRESDLPRGRGLRVLAASPDTGPSLVEDAPRRAHYLLDHLEYDAETLADEYLRDLRAGRPMDPPCNYFPGGDPRRPPVATWRPYATRMFRNWLETLRRAGGAVPYRVPAAVA